MYELIANPQAMASRIHSDLVSRGALAPVSHGGNVCPPVHPWLTPKPVLDWLMGSLLLSSSRPWLSLLKLGTQASLQQVHSNCEGNKRPFWYEPIIPALPYLGSLLLLFEHITVALLCLLLLMVWILMYGGYL